MISVARVWSMNEKLAITKTPEIFYICRSAWEVVPIRF
jgi:hypothetical protein